MKLSTRTRYGVRAILELAKNYGKKPMQLKAIARNQEISVKYLEQLITVLKSAGLVKSVRGIKGGYVLAKPPGEIKVSDCFDCLEGSVKIIECIENKNSCSRSSDCVARLLWAEVQAGIRTILSTTTFQDLLEKNKVINYEI